MALMDYEADLQTEIIAWKESRHRDCVMDFVPKPRHIKLGMKGLLWSIEAQPMSGPAFPDINQYKFNIIDVNRSATPLSLYRATQPELPPKFELLLVGFKISMKSISKAKEALDKMYGFSRLFRRTEKDQRWWIVVDADIAATACLAAKVAVLEAAMATAALFPPPPANNPTSSEDGKASSTGFEKRERAIEGWTPADELWAASFWERSSDVRQRIEFLSVPTERGDVLQWCGVHVIDTPLPSFEIVVELDHFLKGDNVVLRIGVFSHVAVRVRVALTDNVEVVCSQEGVDIQTSLGLGYLLPGLVRDYIKRKGDTCKNGFNVVEGLLRCVVGYLGLLSRKCVVCGSDRLLQVPLTSACDNICKARKENYDALVVARRREKLSEEEEEEEVRRREEYVKGMYPNTWEGRMGSEKLVGVRVVEKVESKKALKEEAKKGRAQAVEVVEYGEAVEVVEYGEAVTRIARMTWRSVATATRNRMVGLWKEDEGEGNMFFI